jgi:hypothetical protein
MNRLDAVTDGSVLALRDAATALKGRDWSPSIELAMSLVNAAEAAVMESGDPATALEARNGLALAEHLFKLRGARLVESNLLVAQQLRTEWALGRELPSLVRQGQNGRKSPEGTFSTLADLGLSKKQSAAFQRLALLDRDDLEERIAEELNEHELSTAWALRLLGFAPDGTSAAAHVGYNSGENEWYTPPELVEAARATMGSIDFDPASTSQANERVHAAVFCDAACDGLTQPWHGNVWLNPPYAQPLISQFASAAAEKFEAGEFAQACVLVNNATETSWFQRLLCAAAAICFVRSRVRFLDPQGMPGAPLQGQIVLYLGTRAEQFAAHVADFGPVWRQA